MESARQRLISAGCLQRVTSSGSAVQLECNYSGGRPHRAPDEHDTRMGRLDIKHTGFVEASKTADHQTTRGLREILEREGNADDLIGFMQDRMLPVEGIEARNIAEELLKKPPALGYLTISNALQWRLQYSRVITVAGSIESVVRIR